MESACDTEGNVIQSTRTFAQQSMATLRALEELIQLHETEVAALRAQLQTVPATLVEGNQMLSMEDGARPHEQSSARSCEDAPFPGAGFSPLSSWKPSLEEAPADEAAPPQPSPVTHCEDRALGGTAALSFSSDSSESSGGSLSSSEKLTAAKKRGLTFILPQHESEADNVRSQATRPGPSTHSGPSERSSRERFSLGRDNRASLSSLQDFGSWSEELFVKSRAFRTMKGRHMCAAVVTTAKKVFRSATFEFLFCGLILLDCFMIGLAVEIALVGGSQPLKDSIYGIECFLTGLFVLELIGKWALFETGLTWSWASLGSAKVDLTETAVTLISGVLVFWILIPCGFSHYTFSPSGKCVQLLMCGRFLRFARFYRLGMHSWFFRDIFVFLRGIAGSSVTFLWAILLLVGFTFAFGIIGVVAISSPIKDLLESATDPAEIELLQSFVDNFVGTLPLMMYTLSKILTGQITCTTFLTDIDKFLGSSWLFWQSYLAFTQVLIMNLITATLVDNAIGYQQAEAAEQREANAAEESKRRLKELRDLFMLMDGNGDGTLSWAEIKEGLGNAEIRSRWRKLNIKPEQAKSCFYMLDRNGVGEVGIEAFFEGLQRMTGVAQSVDLLKTFTLVHEMQRSLRTLRRAFLQSQAFGPTDTDQPAEAEGFPVSQVESYVSDC